MKKLIFILCLVWITCNSFARNDTILLNKDLVVVKLDDNAFVHISYMNDKDYGRFPSNGLIYTKNKKAIVFDTPITEELTDVLLTWMIDSLQFEIVALVVNHWHNDCQEGIELFTERSIATYASEKTLKISIEKNLPVPEIGFVDSVQIAVSDIFVNCYYMGEAHASDNIVCYIPSSHILFGGCMVKSMNSRGLGNLSDANTQQWPLTLQKVKNKFPEAEIVIPGHGAFGGTELIDHTLNLLIRN